MTRVTFFFNDNKSEDSFGAILQKEVLAYLLSLYFKKKFVRGKIFFNSKFNHASHVKKFNNIFNFYGKKNLYIENNIKNLSHYKNLKYIKGRFIYNIPFKISQKFLKKLNFKDNKNIFLKFRKKFWSYNKKKKNKIKLLTLHIRNFRKEFDTVCGLESIIYQLFNHDYNLPTYNTNFFTKWYVTLVKDIIKKEKLKKNEFEIILCSNGKKKEFEDIISKLNKIGNLKIFINKDNFQTFKLMINSDYLILAHSSFSYLASMINTGKKYIRNNFRHPLPFDVKIVKDYELLNISYLKYFYYEFLKFLLRVKIKFKKVLI